MDIKLAESKHINEITQIYEACKKDMQSRNIFQWVAEYPNAKIAKKDIENQHLYCIQQEQKVIAVITLNEYQDLEYKEVDWSIKEGKALVIHRLAVHPAFQSQGLARSLMDFAEAYAQENNYSSIRLDTFSQNPRSLKFYANRNYIKRGEVHFPLRVEPFHCLEKELFRFENQI